MYYPSNCQCIIWFFKCKYYKHLITKDTNCPSHDVFQLLWKIICPEILTPPSGDWLQLIGTEVGPYPILDYFESHPIIVHWN